jgi:hypothetical protein
MRWRNNEESFKKMWEQVEGRGFLRALGWRE